MQASPVKPPRIFLLLIAFSLLIGLFALVNEWLTGSAVPLQQKNIPAFTLVLDDPLKTLPNYSNIAHIPSRKDAFFKALLPLALYENERISWQREQLTVIKQRLDLGEELDAKALTSIMGIAEYYGLEWPLDAKDWVVLERRVHQVPVDLVLMQAANESAWGTSRFAREGNNLFGQWCFTKGCGLVPAGRDEGKSHEVKKFATILESVQAYMNNINTHRAYTQLRELREELYEAGKEVGGVDLAPGLISYSERRQAYVDELIDMMNSNAKYVDHAMQEVGLPFLNQ
ncbi:MAG: hypothetical protein GX029_07065 [Pseudomonadaceae bacterium]|nr:hypothetical protein [Pseudomonadaceae bacterium]